MIKGWKDQEETGLQGRQVSQDVFLQDDVNQCQAGVICGHQDTSMF